MFIFSRLARLFLYTYIYFLIHFWSNHVNIHAVKLRANYYGVLLSMNPNLYFVNFFSYFQNRIGRYWWSFGPIDDNPFWNGHYCLTSRDERAMNITCNQIEYRWKINKINIFCMQILVLKLFPETHILGGEIPYEIEID